MRQGVTCAAAFGRFLFTQRDLRGWSQADLGARLAPLIGKPKVDKGQVSNWEKGRSIPASVTIDALMDIFGLDAETAFRGMAQAAKALAAERAQRPAGTEPVPGPGRGRRRNGS